MSSLKVFDSPSRGWHEANKEENEKLRSQMSDNIKSVRMMKLVSHLAYEWTCSVRNSLFCALLHLASRERPNSSISPRSSLFFFPFLLLAQRSSYYWNERMENKKRKTFRFDWSFVNVHFTISFLKRMKNFASLHLADVLAANNWANRQWLPCSLGLLPPFMLVSLEESSLCKGLGKRLIAAPTDPNQSPNYRLASGSLNGIHIHPKDEKLSPRLKEPRRRKSRNQFCLSRRSLFPFFLIPSMLRPRDKATRHPLRTNYI